MTLTAIEQQQKDPNRVNLMVDNAFAMGLYIDLVWEFHLKVGQAVDQALLNKLRHADNFQRAYSKALTYLSGRPHSTKEVSQYLRQKLIYKHPDWPTMASADQPAFIEQQQSDIDQIVTKLTKDGYLDDVAFAKWWIDNRRTFKPRGARLLLAELKGKGVSDGDIQRAVTTPNMQGHFSDTHQASSNEVYDEQSDALALARKQIKKYANKTPDQQKQSIYRFLASKGYDWDTIAKVWTEIGNHTDDNDI